MAFLAGIFGSQAASNAEQSAGNAATKLGQNQLDFEKSIWNTTQANQAPFISAGQTAVGQLNQLTSTPGSGLLTPWTENFTAPTAGQAAETPGYQFALGAGENAIQNSAAASGGLETTGTAKNLAGYATGLASQTYQQTYNNAFNQYMTRYNIFQNNQTSTFNRLAALAGLGQTSASTLGNTGVGTMNATNATTSGIQNSTIFTGEAAASGYAGMANAITGGQNTGLEAMMLMAGA